MSRGSVNKVVLVGNLGADPELRFTQGGIQVANVSLATSESWTDKTANPKSAPNGTAWSCGGAWPKSPINTSKRAAQFTWRANCKPVPGKTRRGRATT